MLAERDRSRKRNDLNEMNQFNDIYIISSGKFDKKKKHKRYRIILMWHWCFRYFFFFINNRFLETPSVTSVIMIIEIADEKPTVNPIQYHLHHHQSAKIRVTLRLVHKRHTHLTMNDKRPFTTISPKIARRAGQKRNDIVRRKNVLKNRNQIDDMEKRKKVIEKNIRLPRR